LRDSELRLAGYLSEQKADWKKDSPASLDLGAKVVIFFGSTISGSPSATPRPGW
jgi:hypothetical protein